MQQASACPDAIKRAVPRHFLKRHLDNWEFGVLACHAAHLCRRIKRSEAITGSVESQGIASRSTTGVENISTNWDMDRNFDRRSWTSLCTVPAK